MKTRKTKKDDKLHRGAWEKGATKRWKREYDELNPKHKQTIYETNN